MFSVPDVGATGYPVVADLDGDGNKELIIAQANRIFYFNNRGELLQYMPQQLADLDFLSVRAAEDLDDDGDIDIILKRYVGNQPGIVILENTGTLDFKVHNVPIEEPGLVPTQSLREYRSGDCAIGDVNNDGLKEIVAAFELYDPDAPETTKLIAVYIINHKGEVLKRWSFSALSEQCEEECSLKGRPVLGDIDGDGTLDMILSNNKYVDALHYDGSHVDGFPVKIKNGEAGPVVIADLYGEGKPSIIGVSYTLALTGDRNVFIINGEGRKQGFSIGIFGTILPVAVADMNYDGISEIIYLDWPMVGDVNRIRVINPQGDLKQEIKLGSLIISDLSIADIDNDGIIEVIMMMQDGNIHVYKLLGGGRIEWPSYRHDELMTSRYEPPIIPESYRPIAEFSYSPLKPETGQKVYFDASQSFDPDGTIVEYDWDFGDGSTASGKSTIHTYISKGHYEVTLRVTNDKGYTGNTLKQVTVTAPPSKLTFYASCWDGSSQNEEYGKKTREVGNTLSSLLPKPITVSSICDPPFPFSDHRKPTNNRIIGLEYAPYNYIYYPLGEPEFARKMASHLEEYSPEVVPVICMMPYPLESVEAQDFICNNYGPRAYLQLNIRNPKSLANILSEALTP